MRKYLIYTCLYLTTATAMASGVPIEVAPSEDDRFLTLVHQSDSDQLAWKKIKGIIKTKNVAYLKSLLKNHPDDSALFNIIGLCLRENIGCEDTQQNKEEAIRWFRQSAEKGNTNAKINLGVSLVTALGCRGTEEDKQEGFKLIRDTAEMGYLISITNLASCLLQAIGCENTQQNKEEAVRWLRQAAEKGNIDAMNCLGSCLHHAIGCENTQQNKEEAVRWYRQGAEKGNFNAMNNLGFCLKNAIGCKDTQQNKEEAVRWFRQAAERGNTYAMSNLGLSLLNSIGCEDTTANQEEGLRWILKYELVTGLQGKFLINTLKTLTKPDPISALEKALPEDEYLGAGKALALLKQLSVFSEKMTQETNPAGAFAKETFTPRNTEAHHSWITRAEVFGTMSACLQNIYNNKLCLIPTSRGVLDELKLPYPEVLLASAGDLRTLTTPYPAKFYEIGGKHYFTLGDENVEACNKLLCALATLEDPLEDQRIWAAVRVVMETKMKLDLLPTMQAMNVVDPEVTDEDLKKEERMLNLQLKALVAKHPETSLLKDSEGAATPHRYYEGVATLKETVLEAIEASRPYKFRQTINEPLGPFGTYVRE